jgi:hypothetical protein
LKAVHHNLVSSAETRRAFNSGFDAVNLHRPTVGEDVHDDDGAGVGAAEL